MTLKEKWDAAVDQNNSTSCAGVDFAEYEMGRGEKGLPKGADKRGIALRYVEAVAPFCAAIKPNKKYWCGPDDQKTLEEMEELTHSMGLVYILDDKIADIGSTNDAGLFHNVKLGFDAVTIAPYGGNMGELVQQARSPERGIGIITMCLMSNDEYEREKNMWVGVSDTQRYNSADLCFIEGIPHVRRYIQLAHDANCSEADGIVIGAQREFLGMDGSKRLHPTDEEVSSVQKYFDDNVLVLSPGGGHQGGGTEAISKYFNLDNVIFSFSRSLMFPKGSNSTIEDQIATAKHYQTMLNELRAR